MDELTARQTEVLQLIADFLQGTGFPPTRAEIAQQLGFRSANAAEEHLRALERKGYLRREDMKSRALRVVDHADRPASPSSKPSDENLIDVQILGRVAAGLPLLAEENVVDTVRIDRMMIRGGRETFGLRVTGDSMIEAGILNGDYIFVRRQATADRGEIVVALIGDEATVKYYYPEKDYIRFQPANAQMAPILVRSGDFKPTMLLGVVVGVYRRL